LAGTNFFEWDGDLCIRDMGMGMIGMMVGMGMIGDGTKVREDRWRWESPCAAF